MNAFRTSVTMAEAVEAMASTGAMVALTYRALDHLADELGCDDKHVFEWLWKLASEHGVPIGVNMPTTKDPQGPSTTFCLPPMDWTQEQLSDYVSAHREDLAATFGEIERMYGPAT